MPFEMIRPGVHAGVGLREPESEGRGGFIDVEVSELATSMEMPSTDAFVDYLARVHPAVATLRERLGDRWAEVDAELRTRLRAQVGPGPHSIPLVANLSVGRRPARR